MWLSGLNFFPIFVQVEKNKQDDALGDLSNVLDQLKDMAVDMGSEIERSVVFVCMMIHCLFVIDSDDCKNNPIISTNIYPHSHNADALIQRSGGKGDKKLESSLS